MGLALCDQLCDQRRDDHGQARMMDLFGRSRQQAGPHAMIDSGRERNRQAFFALVSRHLKGLYHFVRHELRYREARR